MSRRLVFSIVAGLVLASTTAIADGLPRGDARDGGFRPDGLDRLGAVLEEAVAKKQIGGGSVLVARRGKVVYRAEVGLQDAEANRPLTDKTIFRIASMTKPITSTAVLILVDDGKLKLTDPVSKYLPEFGAMKVLVPRDPESKDGPPYTLVDAKREITVHDLLTHTAGLTYRFFDKPILGALYAEAAVSDGLSETPGTIGDNVKRLARLPLLNQPGAAWEYSLATDVLGRLVEVVSGQTLDEFFRRRIFDPLKMPDTHFLLPESKRPRLSAVFQGDEDGPVRQLGCHPVQKGVLVYSATYPTWDDNRYYSGGAGLVSTADDYSRFLQMMLNRGELDGVRVLRPETVDLMTRNQLGELGAPEWGHGEGFGYGFGIVTDRTKADEVASTGTYSWGGFFYSYFWVDPKNELIGLMMTQTYPNGHLKLREGLKKLTYEALAD